MTDYAKFPGIDGQKMSKSYANTINLREEPDSVTRKIKAMPTDPARVRRTDAGNPELCPVWSLHKVYSDKATQNWVTQGCTSAAIGCIQCKQKVIDRIIAEQQPIIARAEDLTADKAQIEQMVTEGNQKAQQISQETLNKVKAVFSL